MRALLGTDSHLCEVVVLKLRTAQVPVGAALSRVLPEDWLRGDGFQPLLLLLSTLQPRVV